MVCGVSFWVFLITQDEVMGISNKYEDDVYFQGMNPGQIFRTIYSWYKVDDTKDKEGYWMKIQRIW